MKKIYILIVFALAGLTASAQNLRTGYFLDGYSYQYQFNPAFQGERGFIALPIFSRVGIGAETSIALKDFLYTTNSGTLGTFLHPEVSDAEALKNLGKNTIASTNLDLNLFGLGFRAKKSYHTLDLSLKTNVNMTLPGDIFKFMKVGASDGNAVYDLSDLGVSAEQYVQLAYGFSRRFNDKFNIGIRLKALMGTASIRSDIRDITLKMAKDEWMVKADGSAMISSLPSRFISGDIDDNILNELQSLVTSPNLGFAADLGFSVDVLKYITLSASILDLGYIGWKNADIYSMTTEPWIYNGFNLSDSGNFNDQLNSKLDELGKIFDLNNIQAETKSKHLQKLAMTVHVGAEARLPFYERLSAGVLATHRFNGPHSWTEGRFSINWALLRWFSLAANYAISDLGHSYGAAVNLHAKGFSAFLGTDSFRPLTAVSPNMIPLNDLNTNVVFGVNFPFGKYNGRFPKKTKEKNQNTGDSNSNAN